MDLAPYIARHPGELGALAMLAAALATAAAVWRAWPFFGAAVARGVPEGAEPSDGRGHYALFDGLRGVLCLLVFIHHAQITLHLASPTAPWDYRVNLAPAAILPRGVSVGLFFALTAFLFYRRALDRPQARLDVGRYLGRRVARVAPMLLVSGALMFAADRLGPQMLSAYRLRSLALKVATLAAYGRSDYAQNASVFWTLEIEWLFYLAFPLLAAGVAGGLPAWARLLGAFTVASMAAGGLGQASILMTYLSGLCAAHACAWPASRRFARAGRGAFASLLIVAIGWLLQGATPYVGDDRAFYFGAALGVFVLLTLVACGTDFFGLLRLPAMRAMGTVSYSVYLLHGIALFAMRPVILDRSRGPLATWAILCALTAGVVLASFACYRWIEHPGIALGKRLLSRRQPGVADAGHAVPVADDRPTVAGRRRDAD